MIDYSEIVAEAGAEAVREITETITAALPVTVVRPPSPGMVMVRHADPLENTLFLLGESFVTECEVEVAGHRGYGCVLGPDEQRATCGALVDAVISGLHGAGGGNGTRVPESGGGNGTAAAREAAAHVMRLLEAEEQRIKARREQESRAVASTRVSFEVR